MAVAAARIAGGERLKIKRQFDVTGIGCLEECPAMLRVSSQWRIPDQTGGTPVFHDSRDGHPPCLLVLDIGVFRDRIEAVGEQSVERWQHDEREQGGGDESAHHDHRQRFLDIRTGAGGVEHGQVADKTR